MLKKIANTVRGLSADGVEQANSGHPGLPLGSAEIGSLLYGEVMKYDPQDPNWPDRDRFVLSAGHGSMLVYSLLQLSGFDLTLDDLKKFRQLGSKTPGHPEYGDTPGVETTTGPLGQGFANAVGMAVAERMLAERFNTSEDTIVDHYTYTLLGDGGMMEGVVAEAASLAGHLGLGRLIAFYDDNEISIGGNTDITFTEDVSQRFKAYNWQVIEGVDGHDLEALREAVREAKDDEDRPTLIVATTKIAYGAPTMEGTAAAHGAPLGDEEIKGMKKKLDLPPEEQFYVSEEVREFFKRHIQKLSEERKEWQKRFDRWSEKNPELREAWDRGYNLTLPANFREELESMEIKAPVATRKASGSIMQKIAALLDYFVGGSADLAPSNKTYLEDYDEIQKASYGGRNFRFGVREHAMGSIVNGIALHKGFKPFCSTFLVFSDYMRPAIRMAALMKQPVVYVFTHDSFYVGEDGPTHQPVEHIEALRMIPGLTVLRPADEEETKGAWIQAMENTDGPTALILTRQGLPHLDKADGLTGFYQGGYVLEKEKGKADLVIMASGSEVSLAVEVAAALREKGKNTRVLSIPERKSFLAQRSEYVNEVVGDAPFRVVIEAGVGSGWFQLLGDHYHLVSVERFGASGQAGDVAVELGFTVEKITADILNKL